MQSDNPDKFPGILYIEDDKAFSELFSLNFRKLFDVTLAFEGKKAIELLKKQNFDAIITDYDMPGMNGLQVLEAVKNLKPDIPVIFYTGQGNEEIAREAFIKGACDYFTKDIFSFAHKEKFVNSIKKAIEKRQAEIDRKKSEEKYYTLFNYANDSIFLMKGSTFVDCNIKALEVFGVKKEEIIGCTPFDFSPEFQPDGRNSKEKALEHISKIYKNVNHRFEWVHKRKDNQEFYTDVSLTIMKLDGEDFIQTIIRDITQIKNIENSLKQSEEKFRSLVENIPGVVFRCNQDDDWTMEYISDSVKEITGYPSSDFLNNKIRTFDSIIHPDDRKMVHKSIDNLLYKKKQYSVQYRIVDSSGRIHHVLERGKEVTWKKEEIKLIEGIIFEIGRDNELNVIL